MDFVKFDLFMMNNAVHEVSDNLHFFKDGIDRAYPVDEHFNVTDSQLLAASLLVF